MRNTPKQILAVVPAYNEEGNVGQVARELFNSAPFLDVLVIDDGSTDNTKQEALEAGSTVISHDGNLGIGASVKTGMSYALEKGYQIVVQVDGDGQHNPVDIYRLLVPIVSRKADLVIGSRFLDRKSKGYKPPWHRRTGMLILAAAVHLATGRKINDTTSGFRAMNHRTVSLLVDSYPNDYGETESLVTAYKAGLKCIEVPVAMRKRINGKSSIRMWRSVCFMFNVLLRISRNATNGETPEPSSNFPCSEQNGV